MMVAWQSEAQAASTPVPALAAATQPRVMSSEGQAEHCEKTADWAETTIRV